MSDQKADERSPLQLTDSGAGNWHDACGFASVGILVAGLIIRFILKTQVSPFTLHVVLLSVFFLGTVASVLCLLTGDALSRGRQKRHRWAGLFNALLFILSGYVVYGLLLLRDLQRP
jgi:hypothetical protein